MVEYILPSPLLEPEAKEVMIIEETNTAQEQQSQDWVIELQSPSLKFRKCWETSSLRVLRLRTTQKEERIVVEEVGLNKALRLQVEAEAGVAASDQAARFEEQAI